MRFAAVVPAAPALLPELTGGPVAELQPVRRATAVALERLRAALADGVRPLVVLAPGNDTRRLPLGAVSGLDGFGVSLPSLPGEPPPDSPAADSAQSVPPLGAASTGLSTGPSTAPSTGLALALRLLAAAGVPRSSERLVMQQVDTREPAAGCRSLGVALATVAGPGAVWLVLGDGSARRTPKAPGAFHPDSEAFDNAAAQGLDSGDLAALEALDAELADRLMAAGRAPWQVLAGAAGPTPAKAARCDLSYHDAPLGVGYLVATWDFAHGSDSLD